MTNFYILLLVLVCSTTAEYKINLEKKVTEFDCQNIDANVLNIRCPVSNAVWILPHTFSHFSEELTSYINATSVNGASYLSLNRLQLREKIHGFIKGTFSCCSRNLALEFQRTSEGYLFRDGITCLPGCCPWFRQDCGIDAAEQRCYQLRLFDFKPPGLPAIYMEHSIGVKNSPYMIPCTSPSKDVKILNTNNHKDELHGKMAYIPGHGYCDTNDAVKQGIVKCVYPSKNLTAQVYLHRISRTSSDVKPILRIVPKDGTLRNWTSTINVVRNSSVALICGADEPVCQSWVNMTCPNCQANTQKRNGDPTYGSRTTRQITQSEKIACLLLASGKRITESVLFNVTEKPFVKIIAERTEIPIIQHKQDAVIQVRIDMSPQTEKLNFRAIDIATSDVHSGSCVEWNTVCTVGLPRPTNEANYRLEAYTDGYAIRDDKKIRLISHYIGTPEVKGMPRVGLLGTVYRARCQQNAFPNGTIEWFMIQNGSQILINNNSTKYDLLELRHVDARKTCVLCHVSNRAGNKTSELSCLTRTDVNMTGLDTRLVFSPRPSINFIHQQQREDGAHEARVVQEAELSIECISYHLTTTPWLFMNDRNMTQAQVDRNSNYSVLVSMKIPTTNASYNDSVFRCWAPKNWSVSPPTHLTLIPRERPRILNFSNKRRRVLDSESVTQSCQAKGVPSPFVFWRHGNKNVSTLDRRISILRLRRLSRSNSGVYTCVAVQGDVRVEQSIHFDVNPTVFDSHELITALGVVFVVLLICILFIAYLFTKNRRLRKKLFDRYSLFLRNGDGENNYTTQFDLSQWQLPANALRLTRERLGQGEFGRVMKGLLRPTGACGGDLIPVAVKQLLADNLLIGGGRSGLESVSRRKFLEEIQIMSQVGQHDNVLQMLGIVIDENTLQISLVCEFCEHGNLVNYLQSRQTAFSMRPFAGDTEPCLTYEDLLCLSGDIARGMSHIHSMGVLHRDLAARNVLVGTNKRAKISDFGLSRNRSEYVGLEYARGNTNEKLPWKWLALECLRDGMFSAKSDVWSFGITLWEVFSLGNKPYPEQYYTNYFIRNLNSGYRLSRPAFASDSVFEVMKSCWLTEPELRPSFSQIAATFQSLLDRWRAEGDQTTGSCANGKRLMSHLNGQVAGKPVMNVQYVNVIGTPHNEPSEDCEIKLMEAYVPMSEGSAYTTYSHVF